MLRHLLIAALCLYLVAPAFAQPQQVPTSPEQIQLSFAPVVKRVAPAVVNIFTKQRVQVQNPLSPFADDPFFKQFFGEGFGLGLPREREVSSLGSGVIVSADGTIVTSHHVIKGADQINIVLFDKREFTAKLVKADAKSDIAILKINAASLPYLQLRDSDTLEVGDLVLAIGNPFGVGQTVTHGIVSALARRAQGVNDFSFFIQTDAAINPGNSGGALVDLQGKLVGINTAIYSTSGGSNGIGFAIPTNMVKAVLSGKVQGTELVRPSFGVSVQNVTQEMIEALGTSQGALVKGVDSDSPAAKAGIQVGDVIVGVDNKTVTDAQSFAFREATTTIGRPVQVAIFHGGAPMAVTLTPAEMKAKIPLTKLSGNHPLNNVIVADISEAYAEKLKLAPGIHGVVVAQDAGKLKEGDLLVSLNGTPIVSSTQLKKLLAQRSRYFNLVLNRGGAVMTLSVR